MIGKIIALACFSVALFGMEYPHHSDIALLVAKIQDKQRELANIRLKLEERYQKLRLVRIQLARVNRRDELLLLEAEVEKSKRKYKHIKEKLKENIRDYTAIKESLEKLFKSLYPTIYKAIPLSYSRMMLPLSALDKDTLKKANQSVGSASKLVWEEIINSEHLRVEKVWDGKAGYIFFKPKEATGYLTDFRDDELPILQARKAKSKEAQERLEHIAAQYKIHLMPHRDYIVDIALKLIKALKKDPSLGPLIHTFKVKYKQYTQETVMVGKLPQKERMPRIVIYVAEGKAQKALDKIIALFKKDSEKGIDIAPRWNQKVTKLIFFAQGDGDCKKNPHYEKYFEQPAMIYYAPLFTGQKQNYHLYF